MSWGRGLDSTCRSFGLGLTAAGQRRGELHNSEMSDALLALGRILNSWPRQ